MSRTGMYPHAPARSRLGRFALIGLVGVLGAAAVTLTALAITPSAAPPTGSALPALPVSTMRYAVFLGDASAQGVGATSPTARWVTRLAAEEQWEPINLAKGGTGYVATSGPAGCGQEYCPSIREMVPLAVEGSPDIVVVAGGLSDLELFARDPASVVGAIDSTYRELRTRLPDARIIAVGPLALGEVTEAMRDLDSAVRDVAEEVGATYVSLMEPDLITTQTDLTDAQTLSDAGHAAVAGRIADAVGP